MAEACAARAARRLPAAAAVLALAAAGCAAGAPVGTSATAAVPSAELLVPPGHGSLVQDEITLTLRTDTLLIKVTPLAEWVLRLTAPDTHARLSALASAHLTEVARRTSVPDPSLFLVSIFGRTPGAAFRADDVQLVHRGRTLRPLLVRGMTSGWGEGRVGNGETQAAVYAFAEEIDLQQPIAVEYGSEAGSSWEEVLQRLEAERLRARGRAGLGR